MFALGFGLAMDATAVSVVRGMAVARVRVRDVAAVALWFGGFQAAMPLAGWLLGRGIGRWMADWDHWIAFGLLSLLGLRMIVEALRGGDEVDAIPGRPFRPSLMLPLAVATSIDALAAGVTLPVLGASLATALVVIGATTAVLSAAGLFAGRRFGAALGRRLDAVGGLVLIGLGTKILIEHLTGRA